MRPTMSMAAPTEQTQDTLLLRCVLCLIREMLPSYQSAKVFSFKSFPLYYTCTLVSAYSLPLIPFPFTFSFFSTGLPISSLLPSLSSLSPPLFPCLSLLSANLYTIVHIYPHANIFTPLPSPPPPNVGAIQVFRSTSMVCHRAGVHSS